MVGGRIRRRRRGEGSRAKKDAGGSRRPRGGDGDVWEDRDLCGAGRAAMVMIVLAKEGRR